MIRFASVLAVLVMTAVTSRGDFIINISQLGNDVVATGSGTLNTTALTPVSNVGLGAYGINASAAFVVIGAQTAPQTFTGFSGPTSFGLGPYTFYSSGAGNPTGINGSAHYLVTPAGYTSGDPLSGTMTWDGTTIAGLGLTQGTYTWTWGSGATADSFELNINATATPEPSSLALLASAIVCVALGRSLRRRGRFVSGTA